MSARDVVILGAARMPIARSGGAFKDVRAAELGMVAAKAALIEATICVSGGMGMAMAIECV